MTYHPSIYERRLRVWIEKHHGDHKAAKNCECPVCDFDMMQGALRAMHKAINDIAAKRIAEQVKQRSKRPTPTKEQQCNETGSTQR